MSLPLFFVSTAVVIAIVIVITTVKVPVLLDPGWMSLVFVV